MLKSVLLPMTVVAVTATAAAMTACQDEKVVPVHQEPRHHLVFDSDAIRVLDIQIPPGDTTLFHTHSNPILYVNMSARRRAARRSVANGQAKVPAATSGIDDRCDCAGTA